MTKPPVQAASLFVEKKPFIRVTGLIDSWQGWGKYYRQFTHVISSLFCRHIKFIHHQRQWCGDTHHCVTNAGQHYRTYSFKIDVVPDDTFIVAHVDLPASLRVRHFDAI